MFFFFQAEDGIRDGHVTGVQTCALPIYRYPKIGKGYYHEIVHVDDCLLKGLDQSPLYPLTSSLTLMKHLDEIRKKLKIGRASCRERVKIWGGGAEIKRKSGEMIVQSVSR